MKQPSELTREQLEEIAREIRGILWKDPVTGRLDPERSWTVETIEWVSGVIENAGLRPDPNPPASPPPRVGDEGSDAAMRRAIEAFVATIEVTGGCVRPGGPPVDPRGEEVIDLEDDRPVPAGDESWPDLADAYLRACHALGREPVIRDADEDADAA